MTNPPAVGAMIGKLRKQNQTRALVNDRLGSWLAAWALCAVAFVSVEGQAITTQSGQPKHRHEDPATPHPGERSKPAASGLPMKRPGVVSLGRNQIVIPDLTVLDQHGHKRRFYSDLFKDKVVVLSFFYTTCQNICPTLNLKLAKLQTNLGDRLGKDVFVVTVTKDPETDQPPVLMEWGKSLGVRPGWTIVTGESSVIAKIVMDFTGEQLGADSHSAFFLLGNDRTGNWTDMSGFSKPEELRQEIENLKALNKK